MTGEPTHTASEMGAARPSYINYHLKSEVSITLRCQLQYVQLVTQQYESRTFPEEPLQSTHTKRNGAAPQFY